MSIQSGSWYDTLFTNTADGTTLSAFTSEASLIQGWNGMQPYLGAFFFQSLANGTGKGFRLNAKGVISSTASNPTFTFFVRIGSTIASVAGTSIGQSAAITIGASAATVTNAYWELWLDAILRVPGMGTATATLQTAGAVTSSAFANQAAPLTGNSYLLSQANNASVWAVTLDPTQAQYIMVSAACGTSNASNAITLKQLQVYGY